MSFKAIILFITSKNNFQRVSIFYETLQAMLDRGGGGPSPSPSPPL